MKPTKFFRMSKASKVALANGSVLSKKMLAEADWCYQNRQQLEAEAAAEHKAWKKEQQSKREQAQASKKAYNEKRQKNTVKAKRNSK